MGRLAETFARLRGEQRRALVIYLTAADPDVDTTIRAGRVALEAGADILEVGVPFSDPVADGPVIQRAMGRALANGGGLHSAYDILEGLRGDGARAPLVVFGYLNPLLWEGFESSCSRIRAAGGDALLTVDAPTEEAGPYQRVAAQYGLDWVSLVAPTSGPERVASIASEASGFLYLVSMTGVTGGSLTNLDAVRDQLQRIRAAAQIPVCVGFGVRDRASARAVGQLADGVVVGSAAVRALERDVARGSDDLSGLRALIAELRAGLDAATQHAGEAKGV